MKRIFFLLAFCILSQFCFSQCPPGASPSLVNSVKNGNFDSGNDGSFTSQYNYCNTGGCLGPERTYAVGSDPNSFHGAFNGKDHTTGSGNFMIVNGAGTANTNVWCQTIVVTPNTQYLFATWVSTMVTSSPARLQFSINGIALGSVFTAPGTLNTWADFNATWNSGTEISATICIVNQNTSTGGNDFGLDDISFVPCTCNFIIDAGKDTGVCVGNSIQLHPTTGANTYQWSPSASLDCSTCESPTASPTVTTTYTLLASYGTCTISDSIIVLLYPSTQANAGSDITICRGKAITLNASGGINYAWSPSSGLSDTSIPDPEASPTVNTTYSVTVTDANGCSGSDLILVTIFKVDADTDKNICPGFSKQLNATPGADSYKWTPAQELSCSDCLSPIATPTANTTFKVVTLLDGCADSAFVALHLHPPVNANAGPDLAYCRNNTIELKATGGVSFEWSPTDGLDNPLIANPHPSPSVTTTYTVTVTDSNGCTGKDEAEILLFEINNAIVSPADTTICAGQSVTISSKGGKHYSWLPESRLSNASVSNPLATPAESTTYTLAVFEQVGCTAYTIVQIHVAEDFSIGKTPDATVCDGESLTLNVSGGDKYYWSPLNFLSCNTCQSVSLTPAGNITYTISVTKNGCKKIAAIEVNVIECLKTIVELPTAFSPNGDGKNDFLSPILKEVNEIEWKVFNRWGEMIFETNQLSGKWDGKYKQQDQPLGVYVWFLSGTFNDGTSFNRKGNVTLLR